MPSNLSSFVLPPLPLSGLSPPTLPVISDPTIERRVYTHSSYVAKNRTGRMQFDDEPLAEDNEKYEHVGDALLGCAVTMLLQDMYPSLNPGTATLLKSHLVSNETLRQISHLYHLPSRLIAPPQALPVLRNGDKVPANLFEAYLAGVHLSHLKHGLPNRPSTYASHDDSQPQISISHSQSHSPSPGPAPLGAEGQKGNITPIPRPTSGEAREYLESTFLRPLFTPLAEWALAQLKDEQTRQQRLHSSAAGEDVDMDLDIDVKALGAAARLNQWFIAKEGSKPDYPSTPAADGGWNLMCCAKDGDGNTWYGQATRSTKKAAMAVAAYKVCVQFEEVRKEFGMAR